MKKFINWITFVMHDKYNDFKSMETDVFRVRYVLRICRLVAPSVLHIRTVSVYVRCAELIYKLEIRIKNPNLSRTTKYGSASVHPRHRSSVGSFTVNIGICAMCFSSSTSNTQSFCAVLAEMLSQQQKFNVLNCLA